MFCPVRETFSYLIWRKSRYKIQNERKKMSLTCANKYVANLSFEFVHRRFSFRFDENKKMAAMFAALRAMFYLLKPSETYYERLEDVPDYVVSVGETSFWFWFCFFFHRFSLGDTNVFRYASFRMGDRLVSRQNNAEIQRYIQFGYGRNRFSNSSVGSKTNRKIDSNLFF